MVDEQMYTDALQRSGTYAWRKLVGFMSLVILIGLAFIFRFSVILGGVATVFFGIFMTWIMFVHEKWSDTNLIKRTIYLFHPGIRSSGDRTELRMRQFLMLMMLAVMCYMLFTMILESL